MNKIEIGIFYDEIHDEVFKYIKNNYTIDGYDDLRERMVNKILEAMNDRKSVDELIKKYGEKQKECELTAKTSLQFLERAWVYFEVIRDLKGLAL